MKPRIWSKHTRCQMVLPSRWAPSGSVRQKCCSTARRIFLGRVRVSVLVLRCGAHAVSLQVLRLLFIARTDPDSPFHMLPKELVPFLVKHVRRDGISCMVEEAIRHAGPASAKDLWG